MDIIKLEGITKVYKNPVECKVLKNVTLNIIKGEMVAIIGPSGSGKSTLLNILGAMDKQTMGKYIFEGNDISNLSAKKLSKFRNENIGFVFQNFFLLKSYSVFDNVYLPMIHRKDITKLDKRNKVKKILKELGVENEINKKASQLSGGQQQRVAIARALVNNPSFILADEPTGSLDMENGKKVIQVLKRINNTGTTVIIVTHDMTIASECNRIIKIVDGQIYH